MDFGEAFCEMLAGEKIALVNWKEKFLEYVDAEGADTAAHIAVTERGVTGVWVPTNEEICAETWWVVP